MLLLFRTILPNNFFIPVTRFCVIDVSLTSPCGPHREAAEGGGAGQAAGRPVPQDQGDPVHLLAAADRRADRRQGAPAPPAHGRAPEAAGGDTGGLAPEPEPQPLRGPAPEVERQTTPDRDTTHRDRSRADRRWTPPVDHRTVMPAPPAPVCFIQLAYV